MSNASNVWLHFPREKTGAQKAWITCLRMPRRADSPTPQPSETEPCSTCKYVSRGGEVSARGKKGKAAGHFSSGKTNGCVEVGSPSPLHHQVLKAGLLRATLSCEGETDGP